MITFFDSYLSVINAQRKLESHYRLFTTGSRGWTYYTVWLAITVNLMKAVIRIRSQIRICEFFCNRVTFTLTNVRRLSSYLEHFCAKFIPLNPAKLFFLLCALPHLLYFSPPTIFENIIRINRLPGQLSRASGLHLQAFIRLHFTDLHHTPKRPW